MDDFVIINATTASDIAAAQNLFKEYGEDVSRAYCLKGFDQEVSALPGDYAPPEGCLLLMRGEESVVGMVAIRRHAEGVAEMKRLYVRPSYIGKGLGRQLAQAAVTRARQVGYRRLRLDTLEHMKAAQALYKRIGFVAIPAYHQDIAPGMVFMELTL